ncbi:MAG: glycerol kinase GlpK [Methylotetracoccus sp.]
MTKPYVAALDQGTTSTRCVLFERSGGIAAVAQREHAQHYPRPGWVEHDPLEIWRNAEDVMRRAMAVAGVGPSAIAALGIANQRETVVVWERDSGRPIHPALVWQDTRTADLCRILAGATGTDRFRAATGLPIATYFSGPKLRWLLDEIPGARARAEGGELLAGTIDTWLIWNLTGGVVRGKHVTDVSNASRTLLMNLDTLAWDPELLAAMAIPEEMLPEIRASSEVYSECQGVLAGVPVAGDLGDQQAALFGQCCFEAGDAKNTYGTGCFLLLNTGRHPVMSSHGLLSTVAWRLAGAAPQYALEGGVAVAGSLVQWLRDRLGLIGSADEVEALANNATDNGGVYIVPAFSGLFAPHWRSDARGAVMGLTAYAGREHLARAALEATAYQTRDLVDAMQRDAGFLLNSLKVDGGMVVNETLMQFQADILGVPVIRPTVIETTARGAAFAAGLAVGFWRDTDELRRLWHIERQWSPTMEPARRDRLHREWTKAVSRTFAWLDPDDPEHA